MNKETVKMTEEEFKEFMQKESSRFAGLESEIMKAYGKEQMELFYKIIDFTYKILTVIGLVAGFGFTALNSVESIVSFIAGEAFLFSAIIYGLYRIQKLYSDNLSSLDANKKMIKDAFAERREVVKRIINDYQTKGEVKKKDGKKLIEKNNGLLIPFLSQQAKSDERTSEKEEKSPLKIIMILFIIGAVLLLFSLLPTKLTQEQPEKRNSYWNASGQQLSS